MPTPPRIHDVTRPVRAGMPVWPGDAPCRVAWTGRVAAGDGANVAEVSLSVHSGTHADGPYHVDEDGIRIGAVSLDAFVGRARVIDARGLDGIEGDWLAERMAGDPPRILLHTGCWSDPAVFPTSFPALAPDAARLLAGRGVRLVGTDAPSVDPFRSHDLPAHRILLGAGIGILENLLLDDVEPGDYGLIALPLRLVEADSSPVRAVLLEPEP
ncbi:MAG TPA: cyclase family protein [Longimicrobiaceae bacterium]|nr:cyclase family protein [Longimicrobiaceae bacterium]